MASKVAFTVLGAGSWGTALANMLAGNGCPTTLWGHDAEHIKNISANRYNPEFLPNVKLSDELRFGSELNAVLNEDAVVLVVVPSGVFADVLRQVKSAQPTIRRIAWATKGLEDHSYRLLHEVAMECLGPSLHYAVLSGPNFAGEVARKQPTATTIASNHLPFAEELVSAFHNAWFRPYSSEDVIGVQLGGALKNALAIAAGISDGLGFGANARAALLTRGLAEIMRLALTLGAQPETFMGLAGIGDLMLTCTDNQSRNRRLGLLLAAGHPLAKAEAEIGQTVEGIKTAHAAHSLAQKHNVEMPIVEQVYRVLYEQCPPQEAVVALLQRDPKSEH